MQLPRSIIAHALAFGVLSLLAGCVNDAPPPTTQSGTGNAQAMAAWNRRADDVSALKATLQRNGVTSLDRSVQSGRRSGILRTAVLNSDCSPRADVNLHVSQPPKHGHLELASVEEFPDFPKDNPKAACNARKVRNWIVYYTSEPGYTGGDATLFEVVEESTSTPMRRAAFIQVH